jgi:hypothetical protein
MTTPDGTPQPDPPGEQFTLTLEALPDSRPVAVRLRLVLKDLLRREKFRCVRLSGGVPRADHQDEEEGR